MLKKINVTIASIFICLTIHAQIEKLQSEDFRLRKVDSVKEALQLAKASSIHCKYFSLVHNQNWVDTSKQSKTYYRNCEHSGTYVIINSDSTFLYRYTGEGSADYVQSGNWNNKQQII